MWSCDRAWPPAPDVVPVVRFAHLAKLLHVTPKCVAFRSGKMISVQNVLRVIDRIAQVSFIKPAFAPLRAKVAELRFGMVEPVPISPRNVPDRVAVVQVLMYMINQRGNRIRLIGAAFGTVLGLGEHSERDEREC